MTVDECMYILWVSYTVWEYDVCWRIWPSGSKHRHKRTCTHRYSIRICSLKLILVQHMEACLFNFILCKCSATRLTPSLWVLTCFLLVGDTSVRYYSACNSNWNKQTILQGTMFFCSIDFHMEEALHKQRTCGQWNSVLLYSLLFVNRLFTCLPSYEGRRSTPATQQYTCGSHS